MPKPTIPTKAELLALIADRGGDLTQPHQELTPPWSQDRNDAEWRHIRERERKITRHTHRLDRAKKDFEQALDLNS